MPQIGSKIAKKGVKIGNSAQKSAKLDVFRTFLFKKGVNLNSPVAALVLLTIHKNAFRKKWATNKIPFTCHRGREKT